MPELNHEQARNWAKVADAVARKTGQRRLREDLVQSSLLAVVEEPSEDVVDKAVALRQGLRGYVRSEAKERAHTAGLVPRGTDPWLEAHDTPHESWLQMLDEEDSLTQRIREAYGDDDVAEAAVRSSWSRGYVGIAREYREELADEEAFIAEERRHMPIYMQPEYRMDHGEVGVAVEGFELGWYGVEHARDILGGDDLDKALELTRILGKDAVRYAYKEDLTPPEAAHFVNQVAGMVADKAPGGKAPLYYAVLRNAGGDHMALCDPKPRVYLRAAMDYEAIDGKGVVPAGTEVARNAPGATSNYGIEDDDVWMWLFPDGPGDKAFELPTGSDDDILRLIEAAPARTRPEDVSTYTSPYVGEDVWEYRGWEVWDTAPARKAFLRAWLLSLSSWRQAAKIGRNAFWSLENRKRLLARNFEALRAKGLTRDADQSYMVLRAQSPTLPANHDEYWGWITSA